MKILIKKAPRGTSGEGVPVERYLECLRRILASQGITHMQAAKFSTHSKQEMIDFIIRQKWNKTVIETVDLLANDKDIIF